MVFARTGLVTSLGLLTVSFLGACGGVGEDDLTPGSTSSELINCPTTDPDYPACGANPEAGPKCAGVTQGPPSETSGFTYECDLTLTDTLGRPVPGQSVNLRASWCSKTGTKELEAANGVTGADGRVVVSMNSGRANRLDCSASTVDPLVVSRTKKSASTAPLPSGSVVGPFAASKHPTPTATRFVTGLVAGNAQVDLYQSGAYDRVVIVPEYFDLKENSAKRRNRPAFFGETKALVQELYNRGMDVWLFQPSNTGANLHEQAAEFAQAIDLASRTYASPSCAGAKVGVVGINTAGVVARIAGARWEADPNWLASLAIPNRALPMAFLGSADAPQYGLNLNVPLQELIHDEVSAADIHSQYNIDSCAMNQLLRRQWRPGTGVTNASFKAFFVDGTPSSFYSKQAGGIVNCDAGPAVAKLNSARGVPGWPSAPRRYGVSFGNSGPNECLGDENDLNAAGQNVCKRVLDLSEFDSYVPKVGDTWLKLVVNNWYDRFLDASAEDLVPGSRNPLLLDGPLQGGFFDVTARQRFSPTFIPLTSAHGTEGPSGSNLFATVPSPFAANDRQEAFVSGVADVPQLLPMALMVSALDGTMKCSSFPPVAQVPTGTVVLAR